MRNQWLRLLLVHRHTPSHPSTHQVHLLRSFTSSLHHPRAPHVTPKPFIHHHFSSSPVPSVAPPNPPPSDQATILSHIFAKPGRSNDEIKLDLDLKNVVITHDLIVKLLKNPETDVDVAKRVFDWVSESKVEILSSKSYNLMLGKLGANGFVKETWDMIRVMKKRGYGVIKGAFLRVSERFEKDGLDDDVARLKELYASGSVSRKNVDAGEGNASRISDVVRSEVWGDDVEKRLGSLSVEYSSDVVSRVLRDIETEANKAMIFFRWVEESGVYKHDERTYNVMARVLGREGHSRKFWRFVDEMRGEGHEMERETYVRVLERFVKWRMMKDAVDLYEFAMNGGNKPSVQDCTFLLKKIVVGEELDMGLFSKVLEVFKGNGNVLTYANFDAVMKSLISVGRLAECNTILAAMEEAGCVPNSSSQCKVAFKLSSCGKTGDALEFIRNLETSGHIPDYKTWVSLIKGTCVARNLNEASESFREMVEKKGASNAGRALDILIGAYCRENRPLDAYKFILEMVNDKGVSPGYTTYKRLTSKLLARKHFKEALDVMRVMKNQDYAPDLNSFVKYLSKTGSADEAVEFSQAMTTKRFPSTDVFIRLFEAYLKAGRQSEAQDFLSKCPRFIKSHADILNLFCSGNSRATGTTAVGV